jgi:hypothetical protein
VDVPLPITHRWQELHEAATPTATLAAARGLREALLLWEADLASDAVAAGATWEALGAATGVSRQAAWERYSRRHTAGGRDRADDLRAARRAQRTALADARSAVRAARRATGEQRSQLLAEARRQREEALGLLDRKGRE